MRRAHLTATLPGREERHQRSGVRSIRRKSSTEALNSSRLYMLLFLKSFLKGKHPSLPVRSLRLTAVFRAPFYPGLTGELPGIEVLLLPPHLAKSGGSRACFHSTCFWSFPHGHQGVSPMGATEPEPQLFPHIPGFLLASKIPPHYNTLIIY